MPSATTIPAPELRVGVLQFAPRLRDVAGNLARIVGAAIEPPSDLLVTPELSLTGYDLRDDAHTIARPIIVGGAASEVWGKNADRLSTAGAVLVGAVERCENAVPYNTASLIERGTVTFVHRKIYLPTYGMFDEGRYFGRGNRVETFVVKGWRVAVLICEDLWHPMLTYLAALQGVHAVVVMAAAPGRGAWSGGEEGGFFASSDAWERIARTYAQLYGIYVIICNRCGVEGAVTFAGESIVVGPDANIMVRAGIDEEHLAVTLDSAALTAARRPYAHIRDEDVALALREIQRLTGQ